MRSDNRTQFYGRTARGGVAQPIAAGADARLPSFQEVMESFGDLIGALLAIALLLHIVVIFLA